tara:strand:+ start:1125 stop:1463 length:339 start_codon:yes stop_codon:yes gene_type:complete
MPIQFTQLPLVLAALGVQMEQPLHLAWFWILRSEEVEEAQRLVLGLQAALAAAAGLVAVRKLILVVLPQSVKAIMAVMDLVKLVAPQLAAVAALVLLVATRLLVFQETVGLG